MRTSRVASFLVVATVVVPALLSTVLVAPAAAATGQPSSGSSPVVAETRTSLELAAEAYALQATNAQRRAGSTRNGATYGDVGRRSSLAGWTDMMTVSRRWSDRIHLDRFRHNPDYSRQYGYWSSAAENIAARVIKPASSGTPSRSEVVAAMEKVMQQWWTSTGHRRNWMSPDYDHVSIGVAVRPLVQSFDGRRHWVLSATANFRGVRGTVPSRWRSFPTDGRTPPNEVVTRFSDVPSWHTFHDEVEALAASGITSGCGGGRFCPGDVVTRGQMAAFLDRALGLPNSSMRFADTRGHLFEANIAALARAGITQGCNPPTNTRFCPDRPVTRAQMAAFLDRALDLPAGTATFADTRGSIYEDNISALARAGITMGCNPPTNSRFCPGEVVTRGQMAAFLVRAGLA